MDNFNIKTQQMPTATSDSAANSLQDSSSTSQLFSAEHTSSDFSNSQNFSSMETLRNIKSALLDPNFDTDEICTLTKEELANLTPQQLHEEALCIFRTYCNPDGDTPALFVTTYGKYNDGRQFYASTWLDLYMPSSFEEFDQIARAIRSSSARLLPQELRRPRPRNHVHGLSEFSRGVVFRESRPRGHREDNRVREPLRR